MLRRGRAQGRILEKESNVTDTKMRRQSFEYEDSIACGRGELFVGGPQLPLPPMLMFDRIAELSRNGRRQWQGPHSRRICDQPGSSWFFGCHFKADPVMPGCLGLDVLWQLLGFYLGWLHFPGRGRALGVGEVKFADQVLPTVKRIVSWRGPQARIQDQAFARHRHGSARGRRRAHR